MSAWMNDAVPNHNGNGFPHMTDPNAGAMMDPSAFMANQGHFAGGQFPQGQQQQQQQQHNPQQQQQMQGMPNGPMRNASPSFQNNVYQTNSVIPSKRPRPRDDSITESPRQNPGMLPTSRSDTPQQAFSGFQQGAMPHQNPAQFPHIPNGSATASPSPIMGNQMRPGSVPQRVATASPHPFSPGPQQQFGAQGSPVPSEHGTPQPNAYMQNMPPGFNPNFAPSPSTQRPTPSPNPMAGGPLMAQHMTQMGPMGQMPNNMYAMQQQQQQQAQQQHSPHQAHQMGQPQAPPTPQGQQQRPGSISEQQKMAAYQMRLQQQLHGNMQMQAQMQAQQMGRGMMSKQQMPGNPNGQMPQAGVRPQQRPGQQINPEQFMKNLVNLMNNKGLPLDQNPMIGDRPVNLMMLFQAVHGRGGYKHVTAANGWAHIAQAMGLPAQMPNVPLTLKTIYEKNLQLFEDVWVAQQKHRMQQQQQQQQAGNAANQGTPQKPMHPGQQMNQGQMAAGQQPHMQPQTPGKPGQPPLNGFSTPQNQPQPQMAPGQGHNRNSVSVSDIAAMPSPALSKRGSLSLGQPDRTAGSLSGVPPTPAIDTKMSRISDAPDEYSLSGRELSTHGGVDLHAAGLFGVELDRWKPDVPTVHELGFIDIPALTRSLQSGITGEVRLALDTIGTLSMAHTAHHTLQLKFCEDLVDALVDCAEDQLDILAEATVEVSDEVQLTPYDEIARACRLEQWAIKEPPAFGTNEYNLDRAVDRLIAVSTILRNLSFGGDQSENHLILADDSVMKMLCTVIRYLGTRTMLLRTHANTLDFMKDAVVLLSNIAYSVELPSRDDAASLLQFLLSFAPAPKDNQYFVPYEPSLHPYFPHAIDSLAKILARDEPNRSFYKALFAADSPANPHELLTRTFAMSIAAMPEKSLESTRAHGLPSLIEARKPLLMQGLLSAEIVVSIAPGSESGLVKSWLAATEIGQDLQRLVRDLSRAYEHPVMAARAQGRPMPRRDTDLVYLVVLSSALLRRLAEKAVDYSSSISDGLEDVLPSSEALVEALSMPSLEWTREGFLQHLNTLYSLGGH